jgi:lipopolysaccharide transport system permease protein
MKIQVEKPQMIISSSHRLWDVGMKEFWQYRDLLELFIRRTIALQYKQTVLGPLWFLIQPVLTVIMNMVVFGHIARMSTDSVPQLLFYMSGNILWFYFSSCLTGTSSVFNDNKYLFSKVYFPRLIIPVATVISSLFKFAIQLLLFLLLYAYFCFSGIGSQLMLSPSAILLLPLSVLIMAGLGLGLGLLISSLTAKYRDLSILFTFVVQLWMYATPIVYPLSMVTNSTLRLFILLNPMTPVVESFRSVMFGHGYFSWMALGYSSLSVCVLLLMGILVFNKVQLHSIDTV